MKLRIGEAIKENGFTNRQVAKALGEDENNISRYIHGRRKITLLKAAEIADIIGCSLDDLVEREHNNRKTFL
ncbi:helix-turn-helix domain-containing protein [Paucisalibacillus globulus]|uniref:helix-turn-helix domain-containing protein n=1 Tax=Paucisalibacillus globulus TaxID=351095 RepID=UPI000BB8FE3F|nr:helix-turn-helix transcriptional regulator [Paucisalibacillus globulus]